MLILADKVTATYQGDEGLRIYDAYQTALGYPGRLYTGIWNSFRINFAGFHPPGDSLVRSLIIKLAEVLQVKANPIHLMFGVSLFAGIFSHYFMALICYRAPGLIAGFVSLFVFLSSYLMTELRVSSTGEALAIPLMITGVYFLQSGLRAEGKSWRGVTPGGIFFLLSALVRPETAFVLPGLCLALWYVYGFKKATLFGAIAGSFDIFKMSRSIFSPNDDKLSLLNVGEKYFNKAHSLESFLKTDYFKTFQSEPNTAFVLTAILGGAYCLFKCSKRDIEHKTLVILYGCFWSYTGVVIVSQFLGLAPHASYRMAIVSTVFLLPIFAIVCRRLYVFLNSEKNKLAKLRHLEFTGYGTVIITLYLRMEFVQFCNRST